MCQITSFLSRPKTSSTQVLETPHTSLFTQEEEAYIESILMNGYQTWTISKYVQKTGGNRNVVSMENATNLVDCKEIKQSSVERSCHNKITHKYNINTKQTLLAMC